MTILVYVIRTVAGVGIVLMDMTSTIETMAKLLLHSGPQSLRCPQGARNLMHDIRGHYRIQNLDRYLG